MSTAERAQKLQELAEALQNKAKTFKAVQAICADEFPELGIHKRCTRVNGITILKETAEKIYTALENDTEAAEATKTETLPNTPEQKEKATSELKTGQNVAYVRVSSVLQNTDRQFAGELGSFDRVFTDKLSGKTTERPELEAMCQHVREGDTVHVWSIDRLARNLDDLRRLVNDWLSQGVSVKFHKEQLFFSAAVTGQAAAMQKMLLSMMGSFAEFELAIRAERQREGVELAKQAGKYKGRQKTVNRSEVQKLLAGGMGATAIANELGIGRKTVYRIKAEIEDSKPTDQPELL